jgi:hypothetical protein
MINNIVEPERHLGGIELRDMIFRGIQLSQAMGQMSKGMVVAMRLRIMLPQFLPHLRGICPGTCLPQIAETPG